MNRSSVRLAGKSLFGSAPLATATRSGVVARMRQAYVNRNPATLERTRAQYAILQRSLAKLARANARIILGSDTGLEDHPFGMSEQHELESMNRAGMTPMQVIVAATSRAAEYLMLGKMGVLAAGKEADFLVLDANPLDDITNTRKISRVYLRGKEVDRAKLKARWTVVCPQGKVRTGKAENFRDGYNGSSSERTVETPGIRPSTSGRRGCPRSRCRPP